MRSSAAYSTNSLQAVNCNMRSFLQALIWAHLTYPKEHLPSVANLTTSLLDLATFKTASFFLATNLATF